MDLYRSEGKKVGVYPVSEKSWMDMGQLEELEVMRQRMETT
jgi:NDP-sugar pyrophosphorylase family protein